MPSSLTAQQFKVQAFHATWRAFSSLSDVQELLSMGRTEEANVLINEIKRHDLSAKILETDEQLYADTVLDIVGVEFGSERLGDEPAPDAHLDDDSILERDGEELE